MDKKLSDEEVKEMIQKLEEHFREPVMPVSTYCKTLETWAECVTKADEENSNRIRDHKYAGQLDRILLDIHKSNLLYR